MKNAEIEGYGALFVSLCWIGLLPYALDENIHYAAADLVVTVERIREVHTDKSRAAVFVRFHRRNNDLGLAASAPDRAAGRAIRTNEHAGPGPARRGPTCRRHRGDDGGSSCLKRGLKLAEDLVHSNSI